MSARRKNHVLWLSFPTDEHELLQAVAGAEDRSVAAQVRNFIRDGLRQHGAIESPEPVAQREAGADEAAS